MSQFYLGIDVGSTTVKSLFKQMRRIICLYSNYVRHNSDVRNTILTLLEEINEQYPDMDIHQ